MADALMASLEIITNERERRQAVLEKSALMRGLLKDNGFDVEQTDSPVIPVVIGDNECAVTAAAELQAMGFDIRAIRPPTVPEGSARLRISVNFALTEDIIRSFTEALAKVIRIESKSCSVAYL
jgi:7-keto-8-aminopelargonate synthetase-like enzyme